MSDKSLYYELDMVGRIGKQEKKSAFTQKQLVKRTGEVFRRAREAGKKSLLLKKVS